MSIPLASVAGVLMFVVLACVGCSSSSSGDGASLPDYSDGGPPCGSGALATCPKGSFCMEEAFTGGFVCKRVPAACASSPTCDCLIGQAAYDCPRGLWTCGPSVGVATEIGCVAN